ncbi:PPE family protein [Mycobacterium avium]|uniref:PPE domain-containing protein n=1 Tax=Mycobacterium avium TaxID=1764 RepID=UPI002939809A|nr:PPE domain-containing protein [Mycobacterium avium]MDV3269597.1 PPE family protein [Mycobacterium avium]
MTAPIFMASPPELHSALLSSGPGPASLLAAAGAWSQLSAEYASAAEQLSTLLTGVAAGAWQGVSGESYVGAHAPYLAWLTKASADSAAVAAQHEVAATAYTTALATMPTLPELAANHAVHATLVATNFFGVNTVPIAVNEADYARMWTQAATTMSTYHAVSTAAVASTPQAEPAPQIVKSDASQDDSGNEDHDPKIDNPFNDFIANILRNLGIDWDPAKGTVNGLDYDAYTNAGEPIFWVVRALELLEDFEQFGYYLVHNPALAFQYLVQLMLFDWPTHILEIFMSQPELLAPALLLAAAPFAAVGGFAGLAGLAALPQPVAVPAAVAPAAGFFPPYVIGPPGMGTGSGMSASASSSAKRKAPEPDSAAAAAAAAARAAARSRRRRRATRHGHGEEFMDMNVDVDPDWGGPAGPESSASDRGAGALGFAGTARKDAAGAAAGLTTLPGAELGGPTMPMMPGSWEPGDDAGAEHDS